MSNRPDESISANAAENYERFFVPAIGKPLAIDLVCKAALSSGERVLDIACGTGVVARLASEQVGTDGSVSGLDLNPGMLDVARVATPSRTPIEWREASADSMPYSDETFDAALCQMGLQFMHDRSTALEEMRRVLKKDGRALVNVPGPTPPMFEIFAEAMGKHIDPEATGFVKHVFSLHETDEIEGLMKNAGFRDVTIDADTRTLRLPAPKQFLWQYVWGTPLFAIVESANDSARAALEEEVVDRWRVFVEDDTMRFPLRVVTAGGRR
jgi:ubiquinone/menaquinone biosynthesis C-methylase UbiE